MVAGDPSDLSGGLLKIWSGPQGNLGDKFYKHTMHPGAEHEGDWGTAYSCNWSAIRGEVMAGG